MEPPSSTSHRYEQLDHGGACVGVCVCVCGKGLLLLMLFSTQIKTLSSQYYGRRRKVEQGS